LLLDLVPGSRVKAGLFGAPDDARLRARTKALDELNGRCGRDTIGFVAAGLARPWKLRREFVSQRYTTRWHELLGV
jgi:DNA polymerase V